MGELDWAGNGHVCTENVYMFTSCRACVLVCSKMFNIKFCLYRERESVAVHYLPILLVASAYSYVCVCTRMFVTWWVLTKRTLGVGKNFRRNHYPVCGYVVAPGRCMGRPHKRDFYLNACTGMVSPLLCTASVWVHMGWAP